MSSKIITPPDHDRDGVYVLVNASVADVELVVQWLQIHDKDHTIHLYHDGMDQPEWLEAVVKTVKHCVMDRSRSNANSVAPMLDHISKIVWYGKDQEYATPIEYFVKHG
jgi:hypothetical protein